MSSLENALVGHTGTAWRSPLHVHLWYVAGMSTALLIFLVSSCILETTLSTTVLSVGPFEVRASCCLARELTSAVQRDDTALPDSLHVTLVKDSSAP